jgi:excinuclease UvrABC ATPase subunit
MRFSANFACPECGYSISELEPRLFSFNSPVGACPECDGIGTMQFFDPKLVVKSPELSLAGGAIRGWDRRNGYYFQMLQSLAAHFDFDVEMPFGELAPNPRKLNSVIATNVATKGYKNTRSRAFCRTSNAVTVTPSRAWCVKSWPSSFPTSPARPVRASA